MKILISLTYYRPYTSGVIVYAQRLAEALAERGHEVTVLTSRYSISLPKRERINGVEVHRVAAPFRISKGVLMPTLPWSAYKMARLHDAVILHLPNTPIEAVAISLFSRLLGKPTIAVYHCDVVLPKALFNRMVEWVVQATNRFVGRMADQIVGYTRDYADASPFLRRFKNKLEIVLPPVEMRVPDLTEVEEFRKRYALENEYLIGFAGRFATEKGVEFLIEALALVHEKYPNARVLFAGEAEGVIGESEYWERLKPRLARFGDRWRFLGVLAASEIWAFYGACSVLVLPSVNRTESFGLVQVESMLCGTPVIATDLPGVRVPIQSTGMGRIVPPCDSRALAEAILQVLENRERFVRPRVEIENLFSLADTVSKFEALLQDVKSPR